MNTFGEALTSARKAAGMTQDELADRIHVARNTISGWEHGRTVPSVERLRELSKVLNHDFLSDDSAVLPDHESGSTEEEQPSFGEPDEETSEAANPQATAQSSPAAGVPSGKKHIKHIRAALAVTAAAILLAAAVLLITRPWQKKVPSVWTDEAGVRYQPADFSAPAERKENAAYLRTSYKTELTDPGPNQLFMYTYVFTEEQGIPFSIQRLDYVFFRENGTASQHTMTAQDLQAQSEETDLPAYGMFDFTGGFPANNPFYGVGVRIYGTDGNGNELSFGGFQLIPKDGAS